MAETRFDVTQHKLVPKHEKLSQGEVEKLYEHYNISFIHLPKITASDAAIQHLKVKAGDVIKITRPSSTAGETVYYRGVTNG